MKRPCEMKLCPNCDKEGNGNIWCPHCKLAYDPIEARETLESLKWKGFTGEHSTNPKMEEFAKTGDPSVFAKKGALDYSGK